MDNSFVLSIDCGTQSIRALVIDKNGFIYEKEKLEFKPYYSPKPGWAEQDPEVWWQGLCYVVGRLKDKCSEVWDKLLGVTVTTQRDTGICVDKEGKPLRPAIIWLDQRMAACKGPISKRYELMFLLSGMRKASIVSRRKSKSNWIKENEPEIWDKTFKYMLLSGYLNFKLTNKFVDTIAAQIGHIPFNYKRCQWPRSPRDYRYELFGIDEEKLPSLVKPGDIMGFISKEVSEKTGIPESLPIVASGSDKGCETLGVGCKDLSYVNLSFGTTATVQSMSPWYFEPIKFMPAYPACVPGFFNPEFEIFRGYWMLSWFKREFAEKEAREAKERGISEEDILNERLMEIPPGAHGLMLQPYWGPGLKFPKAKGSIIGFGDVHTRIHIYRAIIEGINYGLRDGIEKIERKSRTKVQYAMVSGGGSQSDTICQITADMLDKKVYKTHTHETSGLGAAIVTFVALGVYKNYIEAIDAMVHYHKVYTPNAENAELYSKLFNRVYKKVYSKLKVLYNHIQSITNYPDI